jgi:hypothetical protein
MRRQIGLLSMIGFFGLLAAANAQAPSSSSAGASFDGTYRPVSSTKVNDMYTSYNGQMGRCPDRKPGPLHIDARIPVLSPDWPSGCLYNSQTREARKMTPMVEARHLRTYA